MDEIAIIKHHLERIFLKKIIAGLRDKSMSTSQAKRIANEFLTIEPFTSMGDAYKKIEIFVAEHPEFSDLKEYIDVFENEKNIDTKINQMKEHIKQNNIDAALEVAKS